MKDAAAHPSALRPDDSVVKDVAYIIGLAVIYFVTARLGLLLASVHTNVSPVWPPTGIAIAAVLLLGYRAWPGILVGAFLANFLTPVPAATAGTIALGNTFEALSAAFLLRSIAFHDSLDRARDVFKFVVVATLCTMIAATIGSLSLCLGHAAPWTDFGLLWRTWWLGDLTGAVIVSPLLLTWGAGKDLWLPKRRYLEGVLLLVLLSLSAIVTFGKSSPMPINYYPLTRLIVPFLLWAAFRLGRRGVIAAITVISAFAVWGTAQGSGPFIGVNANESLLMLQLFLGTNAVTFLFLGAVVEERRRSEDMRRENERRLAANLAVTRILAESPALSGATPRILQTVGESLGWEVGGLWTVDHQSEALHCLKVWHSGSTNVEKFESLCYQTKFQPGIGLPGRVWTSSKPAWIPDVTRDDNFPRAQAAAAERLHAAFAFPILVGNRFLGVMEFFSHEIRQPDEALLEMFESIGNQIGQFIERKRAEEALLQNREWLRLTMEGSFMGTWTRDLDEGNRVIWSPELERIFGLEPGEFPQTEQAFFDLVHPDDRGPLEKTVREAIENHTDYQLEFRYTHKDGSERWMMGRGRAFYNQDGKACRLAGLGWDITERKLLEGSLAEAVRQQKAQYLLADRVNQAKALPEVYQAALDAIQLALNCDRASILLYDDLQVMRFVAWHGLSENYRRAAEDHSPWKRGEKNPKPITFSNIGVADLAPELKSALESEGIQALAFIPLVSYGQLIGKFMTYYNAPHEFESDEIDLSLTLGRQLTIGIEHKRAEKELRDREALYRSIIQALPAAVYMTDAEGRITMFNEAAVELSGRVPEIGNDSWCVSWKLYWPDGTPMPHDESPMAIALKQGEAVHGFEAIAERPDGSRVNLIPYPTPLRDSTGKVIGAINMLVDITARKQVEETLRRNEKELTEFFENATEAIHWVGPEGTILRANQAELQMLGFTVEEYVGRNIAEFHVDQKQIKDILGRLRNGEALDGYSARMRRKDGSIRDVVINLSAYFENGKFIHTRCFTRDVTEQLQIEKTLRHFAAIVESTDDVVISKDLNGIILSWNPAAEKLYGYKFEEVVGRPVSILIPPDRPDEEPAILDRLRRGERIDHYETVRLAKDGRRIHVSLTVSPIIDASGKVVGASKIARDISEQKRAQEEIARLLLRERAARQDAEVANRSKDEFLAVLSHELRTPLTAMLGWLSILRGSRLDKKTARHAIETIERNAKAQAQLIEDLVDVSRIVGGKLNLELRPIDLLPVMNAAAEVVRPAADAKDIQLEINYDSTVGAVSGDASRLQQVIWNLLTNAVKFTPKGGSIQVDFRRLGSMAEIVIRDSGVGISADFLPHVFERFRQAESAVTRSHRGMGLGLAIVRHLVELHGGTVSADSEGENKGSTFTIRLPLAEANPRPTISEDIFEREIDEGALNGIRVLLVEDEADARELIALALRRSGADVEAVDSAGNALNRLALFKPHVLLSDIGLPVQSGYDLIRKVRALPSTHNTLPAVALTAFATENDRQLSLSAGFHAHLSKPVDPRRLIEVIRDLVPNGISTGNGQS